MDPKLILAIVQRRIVVVLAVFAAGLAVMYAFRNAVPNSFVGVSHVVLVAENDARDPSVSIVDLPSIATSTVVLERVRSRLNLPMSLINLKANVSASVLGKSSIMAVGFRDQSSEQAISVANAVSDELSRYYDEISTQRYDVNVDRLSEALAQQDRKVHALDARMGQVVAANPFVVSDNSVDNLTASIDTLSVQQAEVAATLQADEAIDATLKPGALLSKEARHEILAADPAYQAIRVGTAKDQAQLAADRAMYTNDFPGLPGAQAKIASESKAEAAAANHALSDPAAFSPSAAADQQLHLHELAVVAGDRARLAQLDGLVARQKSNIGALPTVGNAYNQLRAERDAAQTEYTALASRRANALANRAEAASLGSVVVLDRAIKADTQLAGGRGRAAVVSFLLVVALALGSAFLVESLDPRIRRAEEIEGLYGIPVVAHFSGAKA